MKRVDCNTWGLLLLLKAIKRYEKTEKCILSLYPIISRWVPLTRGKKSTKTIYLFCGYLSSTNVKRKEQRTTTIQMQNKTKKYNTSQAYIITLITPGLIGCKTVRYRGGGGGGVWGTQQTVIRKGSGPGMKPLPFYLPFLIGKVPLSYTFHRKLYHFHMPMERLLLNFSLEEPLKHLDESAVRCVCSRYFVKSLPFYIPPAWKGYPFRSEPPHIVRYSVCLPPPPPPRTQFRQMLVMGKSVF